MSASVHRVVSKVEMGSGRTIKTEIHPDTGWVLVDHASDVSIIERFRANDPPDEFPITDKNPNDAIRIAIRKSSRGIEIAIDREYGGAWWPRADCPTLRVRFDSPEEKGRMIRLEIAGGALTNPIPIGAVALFPPANSE